MFISQPSCGDACVIGSSAQAVGRPTICTSSTDAAAMHQHQPEQQAGFDRNGGYTGEGSACAPAVETHTGCPQTTHKSSEGQSLASASLFVRMQLTASEAPSTLPGSQVLQGASQSSQSELQQINGMLGGGRGGGQLGGGSLCRKPGRGDTTLSMSCSDKLARWALLGVQVCCSLYVM